MVGSTNRVILLPLVAAILPILYLNWYPLLNKYAGRLDVTDVSHLFALATHGSVNNEKCWTFPGMDAFTHKRHELTTPRRQSM
jgi:hypothetical protein